MRGIVGIAALVVALTSSAAFAEGNCHTYAMAAIRQYQEAASIPGCFRGPLNRRWAPDYDAHRSWCESVGMGVAHGEFLARRHAIETCRYHAGM